MNTYSKELITFTFNQQIADEAGILFAPRLIPITRDEALELGQKFASLVRRHLYQDARIFVFGSTIKGCANLNSDIDIAVISKKIDNNIITDSVKLNEIAREVSWHIEVHTIAWTDWCTGNPHVYEVQKWGVEV